MITESDCTIFIEQENGGFERQVVRGVHWEDTRGLNHTRTGQRDTDAVEVWIPLTKVVLPVLSEPDAKRNYILRGVVEVDLTEATEKDFLKIHDALTITSIAKNNYGSPAMRHWAVGAK